MPTTAQYGNLPFAEASDYLRDKINMPTKQWTDIYGGMHSRAFVVAGAQKSAMLCDFHEAIQDAIDNGTTITDFRKSFDDTVAKYGWQYKGNRGWRTSVIFQTNLSTAYTAGREKQMQEPAVRQAFPYARYRTMDDGRVRPLHKTWNDLILAWNDPWWKTHTPPNGWGCRCWREPINESEARRLGLSVSTAAPNDGSYTWKNPSTGETHTIPNGVDPGWDYNVGTTTWGERLSEQEMAYWESQKNRQWELLTDTPYTEFNRPKIIPLDNPVAKIGPQMSNVGDIERAIINAIGGPEKIWTLGSGDFALPFVINAKTAAQHLMRDTTRSVFIPLIPETVENPFEIWLTFERHKGTGRVSLTAQIIKGFKLHDKGMFMAFGVSNGFMKSITIFGTRINYLQGKRSGYLLWGR